ncbi:MAG: ergothioneine biosynthesis protein EgtB [Elainellaceae cyanobacterium]
MSQPEFDGLPTIPGTSSSGALSSASQSRSIHAASSTASTDLSTDRLSSSRREALRQELRTAFIACRQSTLALIDPHRWDFLCRQSHPDFSPVGWHIGHIAYTEALWILERLDRQKPLRPDFHHLFAADGLPKSERQNLPDWPTIQHYMETVRLRMLDYLAIAPVDRQERLWRFLLQHESQHCETLSLVMALHTRKEAALFPSRTVTNLRDAAEPSSMVHVPAGSFQMGCDRPEALDNERPAHIVETRAYWIDRYPVTCRDFRQFIQAGGYRNAAWWSEAGWQWFQRNPVSVPLYWVDDPVWDDHPVCGVTWYEADAYARFAGKRLPTEAEWEKAARWHPQTGESTPYPWGTGAARPQHCNHHHRIGHTTPVTAYESAASPVGCVDMLGNVWEWTATLFDAYPGFRPFPYRGYSQTYFDNQHYVLRGGSWATRPWALRSSFRNWYHPWMRQMFAGFRCAMDG